MSADYRDGQDEPGHNLKGTGSVCPATHVLPTPSGEVDRQAPEAFRDGFLSRDRRSAAGFCPGFAAVPVTPVPPLPWRALPARRAWRQVRPPLSFAPPRSIPRRRAMVACHGQPGTRVRQPDAREFRPAARRLELVTPTGP